MTAWPVWKIVLVCVATTASVLHPYITARVVATPVKATAHVVRHPVRTAKRVAGKNP